MPKTGKRLFGRVAIVVYLPVLGAMALLALANQSWALVGLGLCLLVGGVWMVRRNRRQSAADADVGRIALVSLVLVVSFLGGLVAIGTGAYHLTPGYRAQQLREMKLFCFFVQQQHRH